MFHPNYITLQRKLHNISPKKLKTSVNWFEVCAKLIIHFQIDRRIAIPPLVHFIFCEGDWTVRKDLFLKNEILSEWETIFDEMWCQNDIETSKLIQFILYCCHCKRKWNSFHFNGSIRTNWMCEIQFKIFSFLFSTRIS